MAKSAKVEADWHKRLPTTRLACVSAIPYCQQSPHRLAPLGVSPTMLYPCFVLIVVPYTLRTYPNGQTDTAGNSVVYIETNELDSKLASWHKQQFYSRFKGREYY